MHTCTNANLRDKKSEQKNVYASLTLNLHIEESVPIGSFPPILLPRFPEQRVPPQILDLILAM
jgi:hypothetical protein